jgi:tetratricopeptide (TPR) repeat protein
MVLWCLLTHHLHHLSSFRGALYIADYSEVIQSFREGSSDHWSELVDDYFCRARAYRVKGDFENAIADYSEIIRLYPRVVLSGWKWWVAAYYKCRAQMYYEKGDLSSAVADLTEAMRLDPKGRVSILQGQVRLVGPDPSDEGWRHKHALVTLAALYAKSGNFQQAIQYQKDFLQLPDVTEEEATDGLKVLKRYEEGVCP